jgi:hypothetical protein
MRVSGCPGSEVMAGGDDLSAAEFAKVMAPPRWNRIAKLEARQARLTSKNWHWVPFSALLVVSYAPRERSLGC